METARRLGQTNALILTMVDELTKGGRIAVVGCLDPTDITTRLKAQGVTVSSELMEASQPMKAVYDEEGIVSIETPPKKPTGYIFWID